MAELLNRVHNDIVFDSVLHRIQQLPALDPSLAFQQALPGFLNDIVEMEGPWPGRDTKRWAIDSKSDIGKAIGPDQRARIGGVATKHIVALRGLEIAGVTQKVGFQDFQYGGMTVEAAERKALLPLRSFNERVSKAMFDVVTSGDFSGSPTEDFRWSATTQDGETVQADIITDTANEVPDVFANSTQTFLWPLRTGGETATGHDHVVDTGAAWSVATAATQRDLVLEHPGAGRVIAYVGATVAAAVRAQAKTEYGAISERIPLVREGQTRGGFLDSTNMGIYLDSVEYHFVADMPTNTALYVASNQKPFHMSIGANGVDGKSIGRGSWQETGDQERLGKYYGFRNFLSAGMKNPVGAAIVEHAA
jgi:hypothetical protein